jgi:hypothetical protein
MTSLQSKPVSPVVAIISIVAVIAVVVVVFVILGNTNQRTGHVITPPVGRSSQGGAQAPTHP